MVLAEGLSEVTGRQWPGESSEEELEAWGGGWDARTLPNVRTISGEQSLPWSSCSQAVRRKMVQGRGSGWLWPMDRDRWGKQRERAARPGSEGQKQR